MRLVIWGGGFESRLWQYFLFLYSLYIYNNVYMNNINKNGESIEHHADLCQENQAVPSRHVQ